MNELQRQHYLLALGVDTYMPRWHLPFAPVSVGCELPFVSEAVPLAAPKVNMDVTQAPSSLSSPQEREQTTGSAQANSVLSDIFEVKKAAAPTHQPVSAKDILAQLDVKPLNIEAFSLSIWRPRDDLMIVDARNSKLALPTELLLHNMLRSFFSNQSLALHEEILRWPMIENSFTKRTANDARVELQTWLSVQHEIRPIKYLWLMGSNSATYFLSEHESVASSLYRVTTLVDSSINALILPGLNEILQKPILKKKIIAALRHYHSVLS